MKGLKYLCVVMLALWASGIGAQELMVDISDRKIEANQVMTIKYSIRNVDVDRFTAPDFKPFKVISGPSRSNSISIVNGQRTSESSWSYQLMAPSEPGVYKIDAGAITTKSTVIKSRTVSIDVVDGGANRQAADNSQLPDGQEYFVQMETGVDTAFPGQMITITSKIYTQVDLASFEMIQVPEIEEASVHRVGQYNTGLNEETINGKVYYTKIVDKIAIFPQKSGIIEVSPYVLRLAKRKKNDQDGWFFFSRNYDYDTKASNELSIVVQPLPQPAPETFAGGVGEFESELYFDPALPRSNASLTARLRITGYGDIKRIQPPDIAWPESFDLFGVSTAKEEYREGLSGLRAEKVFEYVLVPREEGEYDISSDLIYFDPIEKDYKVAKAEASLIIKPGTDPTDRRRESDLSMDDEPLIYDKAEDDKSKPKTGALIGSSILILAFVGLVFFWTQKRKKAQSEPLAFKEASLHQLDQAAQTHRDIDTFYLTLNRILYRWIADQEQISPADVNKSIAASVIEKSDLDKEARKTITYLLDTCEMTLYAPIRSTSRMQDDHEKAKAWIEKNM